MLMINGLDWNIEFVEPFDKMLQKEDGSVTVGCTDSDTLTIYLSNMLSGEFLRKVLCHEVCHAFIFSTGIELLPDEEERLCDFIATYGIEVIELAEMMYNIVRRAA